MKQSRLRDRKLGIKPKKEKSKSKFKIFVIFVFLILFFLVIGIWVLGLGSIWDNKSKLPILSKVGEDISVEILDPVNLTISTLIIPGTTEVEAANQLGTWKLKNIEKLGIDKNLSSDFLKNTVIKSLKFPVIDNNSLSFIDKIKIKLFTFSVVNTSKSTLNLKDTNYLLRSPLADGTLGYKVNNDMPGNIESFFSENFSNLNTLINNQTGVNSEGVMVGKVLEVMGINVASIENQEIQNFNCKVIGKNQSVVYKISLIFNCEVLLKDPSNNFDIEVDLGKNFKSRF
jgi:hypothetical protein